MIVTPDRDLAEKVRGLITPTGRRRFDCDASFSVESAADRLGDLSYDGVLLDLEQRSEDDALTTMLRLQKRAGAPIVILSEPGQESLSLRCLEEGAQEYLHKGDLTRVNLRRALDYAISRHRAHDLRLRLEHCDKLAALGQLTAGVAHEINNPASYVLGNLREIEEVIPRLIKGEGRAGDLELVADMARDCRRGVELIASISKELKFFARSDDDTLETIDITELIHNTSAMTLNEIRHRAQFTQEIGDDVPAIVGSRSKLSQVLINLLINAAHAIDSGHTSDNQIAITAHSEEGSVVIRVADTGSGIPEGDLTKIFEAYYTTKPHGQGTGLGLPICREIVSQHRGTLEVESRLGKGTTFTITLPVREGLKLQARNGAVPPQPVSARQRRRILLIDDEPLLLKSLSRMLQSHHDVVATLGGEKGLELLAKDDDFDTIICDLMMPEVDGLHVYDALSSRFPHLIERLIYLSGGVFTDRMSNFLEELEPRLLDKPVSRDALLKAIAGELD